MVTKNILKKGFSVTELVVSLIMIAILAIVTVSFYNSYVRKAMSTEASALLGAINTAQKIYLSEYNKFYTTPVTSFDRNLEVDARSNKYFTSFVITYNSSENLCYAVTEGNGAASGISATLITDLKD